MVSKSTETLESSHKMIEAQQVFVRYRYQDPPVLAGIDLQVAVGEKVALMGPSGCGKSTLLAHLAGLRRPEAGLILFNGQSLSQRSTAELDQLRAIQLGFVFQTAALLPYLTARQNIELGLVHLPKLAQQQAMQRLPDMLKALQLRSIEDRIADELSVGEAQRVAVLRAIVKQPAVVFADEPTGALDGDNVQAISHLLCADASRTLIVATHDERVAERCDRVIKLSSGQVHG